MWRSVRAEKSEVIFKMKCSLNYRYIYTYNCNDETIQLFSSSFEIGGASDSWSSQCRGTAEKCNKFSASVAVSRFLESNRHFSSLLIIKPALHSSFSVGVLQNRPHWRVKIKIKIFVRGFSLVQFFFFSLWKSGEITQSSVLTIVDDKKASVTRRKDCLDHKLALSAS